MTESQMNVIQLNDEDLTKNGKQRQKWNHNFNGDVAQIEISDFKISSEIIYNADIIVYYPSIGGHKVLKNRLF